MRRSLLKNLYGQDDAGQAFWQYFEEILLKIYTQSSAAPCVFYKGSTENSDLIVLATHVDNVPAFAMRAQELEEFDAHST